MSHKNYKKEIADETRDTSKKKHSLKSFAETKKDWRKYCSYWRKYPDKFLDFIVGDNPKIKLYFYQRLMLRALFRYQIVYFCFTRGSAKSFLQILAHYLKCVMFPNSFYFIAAPTKQQATKISQENIENIWNFFPLLRAEVKKEIFHNDYTKLIFWNGSRMDVVQVAESSRGGRRHGGAIEEIVDDSMKKDTLQSVVIPLMANNRMAACGGVDINELHKQVYYITTAGTRQQFAYEKLMEVSALMAQGKSAISIGAGYELACLHGQLDEDFILDQREQPTTNLASWSREYGSEWSGTSENSLVTAEDLLACRTLSKAEDKASNERDVSYVLAYDCARAEGSANANSALVVIKMIPRGDGTYQKHVIAVYSMEGTHFFEQAIFLKRKANEFKARMVVVDANGLGSGLIDQLVLEIDDNPSWSVVNDDRYNKYKQENSVPILYALKSQSKEMKSSDIHNQFMQMVSNHKVKFLHSEAQARQAVRKKEASQMVKDLMPYTMTDLMCEEILNLEYKQAGNQTQVKQISRSINKDKFSALEYGLWYIHTLEKVNQIRRNEMVDISKFMAIKKPSIYKR